MKDFAVRLLVGPALIALVCGLGMPCGYFLGFIPGIVIVVVAAIVLGVLSARFAGGTTAMIAAALAIVAGLAGAYSYHTLHDLRTGAFVRDVRLADLPALDRKDRLTLREGVAREGMFEVAEETSVTGAGSDRHETHTVCVAYPIVPEGWKGSDPVSVWRFGDMDRIQGETIREHVFHPSQPDALCRKAIARVVAKHDLRVADHPVYLEAMVSDSPHVSDNRLEGPFAIAFLSGSWIVVALYLSAREALGDWWRRRHATR